MRPAVEHDGCSIAGLPLPHRAAAGVSGVDRMVRRVGHRGDWAVRSRMLTDWVSRRPFHGTEGG